MNKTKFKILHWSTQTAMDTLGAIRLKVRAGSKMDVKLAGYHIRLLNYQMGLRKRAGIQEIECHVEWSAW